jgi:hypothetical protein
MKLKKKKQRLKEKKGNEKIKRAELKEKVEFHC